MEKYIDADILKAEIERYKQGAAIARFDNAGENADYFQGKVDSCDDLTHIITSLQQEQESVAERFARIVRGNLIGIDKEAQQKFEQLYFEVTGNKMYGGFND